MHPHTPAQAPNCLTPCTPAPSDKHGLESAHPGPREHASLAQEMGQGPSLADNVCASAHGSYGFTRIQRACEVGRVPEPIFFRGMWRGHIALKNGRRLVAEFATKGDAGDAQIHVVEGCFQRHIAGRQSASLLDGGLAQLPTDATPLKRPDTAVDVRNALFPEGCHLAEPASTMRRFGGGFLSSSSTQEVVGVDPAVPR